MEKNKVVLLILDGVGISEEKENNALYLGKTPNLDKLFKECPNVAINTSGEYVGLPDGQMGNSEVGHMNIGLGRVVYQDLTKINLAIRENTLKDNEVILKLIKSAKESGTKLHLMGLLSDGGVHSHINHVLGILNVCKELEFYDVFVHGFLDGRDVDPHSSSIYIKTLMDYEKENGLGKISTVGGRYYAMDRDNNFDRIKLYYDVMTKNGINETNDVLKYISESYEKGESDEFVKPVTLNHDGKTYLIEDGDSCLFFNFRSDRGRELTETFTSSNFLGFERVKLNLLFGTMTKYEDDLDVMVALPKDSMVDSLGEYISNLGMKQLRIAETEKFAHVTFFFNGGIEGEFPGEERILVPSPKVATYDLKPEMSLYEVGEKLVGAIDSQEFDLIVCNFANGDMVGHTGSLEASIKAVEALDENVGKVVESVSRNENTYLLITADHGNCEKMTDESGNPFTAHTKFKVPFVVLDKSGIMEVRKSEDLSLRDISPTILKLLNVKKPDLMTGESIVK